MRLVTKNIHYSIKSLLYFAKQPNQIIAVRQLAGALNIPRPFLRKILQILSRHNILKSSKGKNGGFVLNVKPDKLRVMDIVNIFRGKADIIDCLFEKDICPHPDKCLLMATIKNTRSELNKQLNAITLAKLLKSIDSKVK